MSQWECPYSSVLFLVWDFYLKVQLSLGKYCNRLDRWYHDELLSFSIFCLWSIASPSFSKIVCTGEVGVGADGFVFAPEGVGIKDCHWSSFLQYFVGFWWRH